MDSVVADAVDAKQNRGLRCAAHAIRGTSASRAGSRNHLLGEWSREWSRMDFAHVVMLWRTSRLSLCFNLKVDTLT